MRPLDRTRFNLPERRTHGRHPAIAAPGATGSVGLVPTVPPDGSRHPAMSGPHRERGFSGFRPLNGRLNGLNDA